jgi:signal transduction histidine kinase
VSAGFAAAFVVVSLAAVGGGGLLLAARRSRAAGGLEVLAGGCGLLALWLHAVPDATVAASALGLLAATVVHPAALVVYPCVPHGTLPRAAAGAVLLPGLGAVGIVLARVPGAGALSGWAAMGAVLALTASLWWRLERAPEHRRPLLWAALATGGCLFVGLALVFALGWVGPAVAVQALVPVALAVGVLRPEAVDVRSLLVGVVVSAVVVMGYLAVFLGIDAAARTDGVVLGARSYALLGLVCALGVRPLTVVLRVVVDRMLFGDRPDPIRAATRMAGRLGEDPGAALAAVREALTLPWAAVVDAGGTRLAESGTSVGRGHRVPLPGAADGGAGTVLVVGLRPGDLTMPAADRRVLDLVAPLLAQILRAQALTAAVQESRGHVVAAREDERRRLRRDLHDGLGPTLTGVAFSVDAARNTVKQDPQAALELLDAVRADTVDAIGHIRRIVYGMRPPALDELGLLGGLRQRSEGLRSADGTPLAVTVTAEGDLPDLPAAVEVAAFRIAVEGLTNVARHAAASGAAVRLAVVERADGERRLVVEVTDDGRSRGTWDPGVGLESVAERAAEVGGVVRCGPTADGGRVEASLPLPVPEEAVPT